MIEIGAVIVGTPETTIPDEHETLVRAQADQTVIYKAHTPLSRARNHAARQLNSDVIAFIDADAYPGRDWVDELRDGFEQGALAVGGPAKPHPDGEDTTQLPAGWDWLVGVGPDLSDEQFVRNTYGCNFAVRRDVFEELGGFDDSLGKGATIPQGEEMDFAARMYHEYGERMLYKPNAVVYHYVDDSQLHYQSLLRRSYDQGKTKGYLGVGDDEQSFLTDVLADLQPFETILLGVAGIGFLNGRLRKLIE